MHDGLHWTDGVMVIPNYGLLLWEFDLLEWESRRGDDSGHIKTYQERI